MSDFSIGIPELAETAAAAAPVAVLTGWPVPEFGHTLADARRLAKRAKWVFVHFLLDAPPSCRTDCILLSPTTFLRATKFHPGSKEMPCSLYQPGEIPELWLRIGA